jgi:signal transduction histidine kinase
LLLGLWAAAWAETSSVAHVTRAQIVTRPHGSFAVPPATPDPEVAGVAWRSVTLPFAMPRTVAPGSPDEIVTTWFRLPSQSVRDAPRGSALYLPRWQTIGKIAVYVDGELVEHSRGGAVWNGYNHPVWIVLGRAGGAPPSEVLIRIDHLRSAGAGLSSVWIGDSRELGAARSVRKLLQAGVPQVASAAFLILGLFAFGVWIYRRGTTYLLFFATSLLAYVRCLHYYLGLEPLPIAEDWFGWLTVNSAGWLVITTYFLAFRLHARRYPRLERTLIAVMAAASLLTLPVVNLVADVGVVTSLAYLLVAAVMIVLSVTMCLASWRSRSFEGLLFSGWNLLNIPLLVHDWMLQNYLIDIEGVYLLPYSILGTSFIFMGVILRRYLQALSNMESANARLELRLHEREAQLNASHEQLRAAEREQVLNEERQRLVRDMHDGLGSALISALAAVESGRRDAPDVAQVLRECIDDLKLTIDSLEPADTDLLLLLATLRFRIGPRLDQAGIQLQWEAEEGVRLEWLTPGSSLQILRILQEVFSNVIKHAEATVVRLQACSGPQHVLVAIEDNGRGFADVDASGGRGLANLRRRARSLQGSVRWESRPGCTRFELSLPVHAAELRGEQA